MPTDPDSAPLTMDQYYALAEGLAQSLSPLAELAELLRRPEPVWIRPSDAFGAYTRTVTLDAGGNPSWVLLADRAADRLRVTLVAGDEDVYLSPVDSGQPTDGTAFVLKAGAAFTIATRAPIYAAARTADSTVSVCAESIDLS